MKLTPDILELINGCMEGNRECQQKFYDRYSPKLYAIARRYDAFHADDILVKSFLKIFNNMIPFQDKESLEGWLCKITSNTACDQVRARRTKELSGYDLHELEDRLQAAPEAEKMEKKEIVQKAVASLSDYQRTLVNAIAVDGYQFNEMAEKLDAPVSTIKTQYYRALKLLREVINNITQ